MSLLFVIDGYNIIHHPSFGKKENRKNAPAVNALLHFIRTKRPQGKNRAVLVFDGFKPQDTSDLPVSDTVEVVFSHKISADEKIIKIVEESDCPKSIVVVSDDKELIFCARARRARAMSVEDFLGSRRDSRAAREETESKLSYAAAHKINLELEKIWLK